MVKLPAEDAEWLSALGDEFLDVGGDLNYYQAIHDGSWPTAVYVLEHALIRAKEKERREMGKSSIPTLLTNLTKHQKQC